MNEIPKELTTLSGRMKYLRKVNNLTQKDLGDRTDVSMRCIQDIEITPDRNPSVYIMSRIAKFFGVTIDYLLGIELDFYQKEKLRASAVKLCSELISHIVNNDLDVGRLEFIEKTVSMLQEA